jgi:hypothetical protein
LGVAINYDAPPTLSAFMDSSAFVRCVMGPVGSGKSSACVLELVRRACEQAPGPDKVRRTRFAVIRNTYGQLRDTTRKTFEQWVPAELGKWHEQEFTFEMDFAAGDGTRVHSEVLFRALDRPQDVKKLLSLELTGCYFNELREIAKPIFDGMQGRVGRFPSKLQGGATWFGIWADTNPWHMGHWGHKLFKSRPEGFRLFRQPGGRAVAAENVDNLPAGYYARLCHGKDAVWIRVYVDGEEATSDVGSIFGAWLDKLEARGATQPFLHGHEDVFTSWDLGRADATAIWFWQINKHGVADVIDFYAAQGQGLSHYFGVLEGKPYRYVKHWLPHDARAKTLVSEVSVLDQFLMKYGAAAVAIGPNLSLADGISASRWHLEQAIRIHPRCAQPVPNELGGEEHPGGVEALREYRYEWDEETKVFSNRPLHNWASHPADAFRYLSCVIRYSDLLMQRPPDGPPPPLARPVHNSFNLEELWEANEVPARKERV